MPGKKHPVLTVLVILVVIALFLGTVSMAVLKLLGPSSRLSFGEGKIGVIPIEGPILDSRSILSKLITFKKDKDIKAIVLRIDSPGGGVGASQEIFREVQRTAREKKVVASLGGVAASGGYYVAVAADQIVANPGSITGSIGVLMEFVRFEDLLKKIGVDLEVLKSGEFKDMGSPHRKLTERDREILQGLIADIQQQFVKAVATSRKMSIAKVQEIADGRIFTGARAKELGLVDALGNFQDAVELAKKMVGIRGDVTLVYPKKDRGELWDLFFESAARSLVKTMEWLGARVSYRMSMFSPHSLTESD